MAYLNSTVLELLQDIYGQCKIYNNNEYYFLCPFCSHHSKKLSINIVKNVWHCWNCDAKGYSIINLLYKTKIDRNNINKMYDLLEQPRYHINQIIHNHVVSLPNEFVSLVDNPTSITAKRYISYLTSRNITDIDIARYNIGYCTGGDYNGYIIIPSYDSSFQLNYFIGRSVDNGAYRHKLPAASKNIIGFESTINWQEPITICEGVFDAMAIRRNAIPLFGKNLSPKLHEQIILKKVENVNIILDNDAILWALDIANILIGEGRKVNVIYVPTDKDASDLGFNWIQQKIYKSKNIDNLDIIKHKIMNI